METYLSEATIIEEINNIPIFDVMNVKGYCIVYDTQIKTFVFAADIAREGGLSRIKTYLDRPRDMPPTSGGQPEYYELYEIRWDRFNQYIEESIETYRRINPEVLNWLQLPIHAYSYIPIEIAMTVLMCCKSQKAKEFQVTLASIIAPSITSNAIRIYERQLEEVQQTAEYYKNFTDPDHLYSSTEIAKEFCMSARTMNRVLHRLRIIYPVNGTWELYQNLARFGYAVNKTIFNGVTSFPCLFWTDAGRCFVINLLKQYTFLEGKDNTELADALLSDEQQCSVLDNQL